jgi:MFS family permease
MTIFLTGKLHLDTGVAGFYVTAVSISGLFGSLIGGKIIDRFGRKNTAVIFQSASAFCCLSCAFLSDSMIIPYFLIASGFFLGIAQPVYGTIITDITTPDTRKAAFSLNYLALNIGFGVGPLIAGFLYNNFIKLFFIGDALTTLLSVLLVAVFVGETKPSIEKIEAGKSINGDERAEEGSLLSALVKRPYLVIFSLIAVLYFIIFSQFTFGLALQTNESFKNNGPTVFGTLMTVNALGVSFLTVFITSLTEKLKSSLNMAVGGIFYAAGFGMLFFINSYSLFILSTFLWTIGEILISTNTNVYIADHTPISHRGRFNSIFPIIRKIGFAMGPLLTGFYIKYVSVRAVWPVTFTLSLLAALLMYKLYEDEKKNTCRDIETLQ